MTVSILETHAGPLAGGTNTIVAISTALLPTDRIVVMLLADSTSGSPGASGLGSWSAVLASGSLLDHFIMTTTGITGGGNITVNANNTQTDYAVWVLRSSVSGLITAHGTGEFNAASVAAGVESSVPDILGGKAGMVVLAGARSGPSGVMSVPGASAVPAAAAWTSVFAAADQRDKFAHAVMTEDATVRVTATYSATSVKVMAAVVFTDGDTGLPADSPIVEKRMVALPMNTVTNIPLNTVLEANDVVVVVAYGYEFGLPNIAIAGMTLSDPLVGRATTIASQKHVARWGTGVTGSKTVVITQGGSVSGFGIVYVIRGLATSTLEDVQASAYTATFQNSLSTPSFPVGPGQVVIFSVMYASGAGTSGMTSPFPASGWEPSGDSTISMRAYAHDQIPESSTTFGTATSTTSARYGIFGLVFGEVSAAGADPEQGYWGFFLA